jgi:hypothetical protein
VSAPPFILKYTDEAETVLEDLRSKAHFAAKLKKVRKALRLLEQVGPSHPGLQSHLYHSLKGPNGEAVWESYIENQTPSAWRMWWVYGPGPDEITVLTIGPHP